MKKINFPISKHVLAVVAVALVASLVLAPAASAQTKWVRGTVVSVGADTVTVKAAGKEMTFKVDKSTELTAPGAGTAQRMAENMGSGADKIKDLLDQINGLNQAIEAMSLDMQATAEDMKGVREQLRAARDTMRGLQAKKQAHQGTKPGNPPVREKDQSDESFAAATNAYNNHKAAWESKDKSLDTQITAQQGLITGLEERIKTCLKKIENLGQQIQGKLREIDSAKARMEAEKDAAKREGTLSPEQEKAFDDELAKLMTKNTQLKSDLGGITKNVASELKALIDGGETMFTPDVMAAFASLQSLRFSMGAPPLTL